MSNTVVLITRIIDQTDLSYNYCWKIPTDKNIGEQRNFRHRIRYYDMLFQYTNFDLRNISVLLENAKKKTLIRFFEIFGTCNFQKCLFIKIYLFKKCDCKINFDLTMMMDEDNCLLLPDTFCSK